jgi:hypothetical protein
MLLGAWSLDPEHNSRRRLVFSDEFVKLPQRVRRSAGHIWTLHIAALRNFENLLREPP